jgi:hypothetical protein
LTATRKSWFRRSPSPSLTSSANWHPSRFNKRRLAQGTTLNPHKLAVISTLTGEMIRYSNAEAMVRQVLIESTGPAIDKVLFSANAAASDRPAGLLNGITALNPEGIVGTKAETMIDDLQALATAVAPIAGNGNIVLVAAPAQAVAITMRAPRMIDWPVFYLRGPCRRHRHRGGCQRRGVCGRCRRSADRRQRSRYPPLGNVAAGHRHARRHVGLPSALCLSNRLCRIASPVANQLGPA